MKIAVLREAGGLGDVIATEPAVRGLKERFPGAELWYAGLPEYRDLVERWPAPPEVYLAVTLAQRRQRDETPDPERRSYLRAVADADLTIDLFCPAFRHERKFRDRTHKSRVRLFCEAAGVTPSTPRVTLTPEERAWAEGYLEGRGRDPARPLAGLQPISCGRRRNWPRARWAELANELRRDGWAVAFFHHLPRPLEGLPGMQIAGLPLGRIAALMSLCELVIAPDSGLFHLASALDVPTLTLWGSTSPEATCEFYPQAQWLWPLGPEGRPRRCRVPCYSMAGCVDPECRRGCRLLETLPAAAVAEAVRERSGFRGSLLRREGAGRMVAS